MLKTTRFTKLALSLGLFLFLTGLVAPPLRAQFVDLRFGRYTDTNEFFIGAGLLAGITHSFYFNPNVEYVTVSNATKMTFNLDFHFDFYTSSPLFFWLGAGLGILYYNPSGPDTGSTDLGANLLFGLGIRTHSSLVPYVQAKFILADSNEFVIGIGLRF